MPRTVLRRNSWSQRSTSYMGSNAKGWLRCEFIAGFAWRGGDLAGFADFPHQYPEEFPHVRAGQRAISPQNTVYLRWVCLGLFGTVGFFTERLTREICLRKIFGAGTCNIVWMRLRQFSAPVPIANAIAWPVA
jgi:hypothetical protein